MNLFYDFTVDTNVLYIYTYNNEILSELILWS